MAAPKKINSIDTGKIKDDNFKAYNPIISPFGLGNNGNTCYKNAAFQMLLSIPEYSEYILGDEFTNTLEARYLNEQNTENYVLDANKDIDSEKAITILTKDINVLFYKFLTLNFDSQVKNTRIVEKYLEETQKKLFNDYLSGAPDDSVAFFSLLLELIEKYGFNGCKENFTNINFKNIEMKAVKGAESEDIRYKTYESGKKNVKITKEEKDKLLNNLPPQINQDLPHTIVSYPNGQTINFNAELITKYLIEKPNDKYMFENIENLNVNEIFNYCISKREETFYFDYSVEIGKTGKYEGYIQKQKAEVEPTIDNKKYLYIRLMDGHTNYKDLYSFVIDEMWDIKEEKDKILSGIGNKFNKFILSDITFKDATNKDITYNLISVIMYTGNHYYNYSLRDGNWYELNDSRAEKITGIDHINGCITETVRPMALLYSLKQ